MPGEVGPLGRCGACPVCDARLAAAPHRVCAEHRCPRCAAELWVFLARSGPHFLARRRDVRIEEYAADLLASRTTRAIERAALITLLRDGHAPELNLDSVDYIELVLEIEDALERVR
jgi:hypothetical protein